MLKPYDEGFVYKDGYKLPFQCIFLHIKENSPASDFHYHDYIELLYGVDCDIDLWINDNTFKFETGDLVIVNPNDTHFLKTNKESKYIVIKFSKSILRYDGQTPPELKYMYPFFNNICHYDNVIKKGSIDDETLCRTVNNIHREYIGEKFGYEVAIRSGLLYIYTQILRYWGKTDNGTKIFDTQDAGSALIYKSAEYILENYAYVTEKNVAEKFSVSYSYFSKKFKTVMGVSFSSYLASVRVDVARKMLLTTDKSITDIAVELGFSSSSHFIYVFKNKVGYSPLNYKKVFKKKVE